MTDIQVVEVRYGKETVHVNRGGLTVRRLEFLCAKIPTPVYPILNNKYLWLETGSVCVDIWKLNKIGIARNNFQNYQLEQTIMLDSKMRGLYLDGDLAYRIWAPTYGVVMLIGQQYITLEPPPLADAISVDAPLVETFREEK